MNTLEKIILEEAVGNTAPLLVLRSRTKIDTGRWWRTSRLLLLVMNDELIVMAASRRRYIERVPFSDCMDTHYCHNTGCLVIAPAEGLLFNQIAMPVSDAIAVLRLMGIEP